MALIDALKHNASGIKKKRMWCAKGFACLCKKHCPAVSEFLSGTVEGGEGRIQWQEPRPFTPNLTRTVVIYMYKW